MTTNRQLKELAVRIRNESGNVGSGLLYIPPSGDRAYVITAAHVLSNFRRDDPITVQCCSNDGETYEYELEDPVTHTGKYKKDRSQDVALIELPDVPELLNSRSRIFFGEPREDLKLEGFCFSGNSDEELVNLDVLPITAEGSHIINYVPANHMMRVQLKGSFTINQADREQEVEGWSGTVLTAAGQDSLIAVGILLSIPELNGLNGDFGAADTSALLSLMDKYGIPYETKQVIAAGTETAAPKQEQPADLACSVWQAAARRSASRLWFDDHSGVSLDSLLLATGGSGICFLSSCIEGSFAGALNALAQQHDLPDRWTERPQSEMEDIPPGPENLILTMTDASPYAYTRLTAFVTKWRQSEHDRQLLVHFRCGDPFESIKFSRQAAKNLGPAVPVMLLNAIDPFAFGSTPESARQKALGFLSTLAGEMDARADSDESYADPSQKLWEFLYDNPECSRTVFMNPDAHEMLLPAVFSLATGAHSAFRTLLDALGAEKTELFLAGFPWFDVNPDWFTAAWEAEQLAQTDPVWQPVLAEIQDRMDPAELDIHFRITCDPDPELLMELDPRYLRHWMRGAAPDQRAALAQQYPSHLNPGFLCLLFENGISPLLLSKIKNPKTKTAYTSILMTATQDNGDHFDLRARILGL